MKKLAFTIGDFDCIGQDHLHLINEMRKIVMPDNEVVVVLLGDYPSFVNNGIFPIQDYHRRANNLAYFVASSNIRQCISDSPETVLGYIINDAKCCGYMPIFVAYDDNKDFKGREFLKKNGVSIRFIKRQYAKTKNN